MTTGHSRDPACVFCTPPHDDAATSPDTAAVFNLALAVRTLLRAPFDAMRAYYASAVRAGVIERSKIGSARFECKLAALERAALGPLARRV